MPDYLVRTLFEGPLDIVGDVHGEIDALQCLMRHLGYAAGGRHPDGRRLAFVGDLTDRGPDSPAVFELVKSLVDSGRAQCVLGNHDLNILLGEHKHDKHWFFGEPWSLDYSDDPTPAVLADDALRQRIVAFFRSLPLVLEREDLRVVHACWDDAMVGIAWKAVDVKSLYDEHVRLISVRHSDSPPNPHDLKLEHQNLNPVKVLTSGKERRVETPFLASGKLRYEERVPWWEEYRGDQLCVFGHYSNYRGQTDLSRRAICIDFAVAKRWQERKQPSLKGTFRGSLAALRVPENCIVFDNGDIEPLKGR
jgi:Calcineurin-like phosphoesterase